MNKKGGYSVNIYIAGHRMAISPGIEHQKTNPCGSPRLRSGTPRRNPSPRRFPAGTGAHFAGFEGV
jgi:hypothetical protein